MLSSTMRIIQAMNKMNTVLEKESIAVTGKPLGFMGLDTKLYQAEQHSLYDPIYNRTDGQHMFCINMNGNNNLKETMISILQKLNEKNTNLSGKQAFRMLNDWIAFSAFRQEIKNCGLNVLQLSEEHVYGLQHTDMNFNTSSFNMPYSVVFVELPPNIGLEDHEGCLPQTIAVMRDYNTQTMIIVFEDYNNNFMFVMCRKEKEFEEIFRNEQYESKDRLKATEINAIRVALLALHISCQSPCLSYPNDSGTAKEAIRSLSQKINHKNWQKPISRFFKLNQNLKTFNGVIVENNPATVGIRKVILKRKGHMRNQPYGPKSSLRKLIWIKPYFNQLVIGDKTNLTTTLTFNNDIESNDVI